MFILAMWLKVGPDFTITIPLERFSRVPSIVVFNDQLHKDRFSDLGINWDEVKKIMKELFTDQMNRPVYFQMGLAKESTSGTHSIKNHKTLISNRKPRGISASFVEEVQKNEWYHKVEISGKTIIRVFNFFKDFAILDASTVDHWKLKDYYDKDTLLKFPWLCVFFHILAHELQHAKQTDSLNWDDIPKKDFGQGKKRMLNVKARVYDLTYTDFNTNRLPEDSYYRDNPTEADAEIAAQEWGPIMVEMYLERVKK